MRAPSAFLAGRLDEDLGEKFPAVFHSLKHIDRSLKRNPVSDERLEIESPCGHGAENKGDWMFKDGSITLQMILDCIPEGE